MIRVILMAVLLTACNRPNPAELKVARPGFSLSPFPGWVLTKGEGDLWTITGKCAEEFSFEDGKIHGDADCTPEDYEGEVVYPLTTDQLMELVREWTIMKGIESE